MDNLKFACVLKIYRYHAELEMLLDTVDIKQKQLNKHNDNIVSSLNGYMDPSILFHFLYRVDRKKTLAKLT